MKTQIVFVTMLALLAATGCSTTNVSSNGGIIPTNEQFSINVPKSDSVKQGTNTAITISLNRGADFKQDVQLDIKTEGISIMPNAVLIKASDRPGVQCQIKVDRDAAIGEYRVMVTGTPAYGAATSTAFVVNVVAQ